MANTKKISELVNDNSTDALRVGDQLMIVRNGETYGFYRSDEFRIEYLNEALGFNVSSDEGEVTLFSEDGTTNVTVENSGISLRAISDTATLYVDEDGVSISNGFLNISSATPTGSDDTDGVVGSITWDDDFIYVKTSAGWASSPLTLLDPTP